MRVFCLALILSSPALAERLDVQRGTNGTVRDCYVWQEAPTYNGNSDTLYVGQVGSTDKLSLLHFDVSSIPADATIDEARLVLEAFGTSGVELEVRPITADWTETSPTWGTFAGNVGTTTLARFVPVAGRTSVLLTTQVQQWVRTGQNLGFALVQATLTPSSTFHSSDSMPISQRPVLEVLFTRATPLVSSSVPALSAACGVPFQYPLRALAPAATSFTLAEGGAAVDDAGDFSWTPTNADRGEHVFTVELSDGRRTASVELTIEVQCGAFMQVGPGCSAAGLEPLMVLVLLGWRRRATRAPSAPSA